MDINKITIDDGVAERLLNPENPLLVDFKKKAPGTFMHSENVMHMMEKVGRELKLNINVCKIIGLYHDIGKMVVPQYYCENQQKDHNIHDGLDPYISFYMISSHVAYTSSILSSFCEEMPHELIKIMIQHHGDGIVKSIFSKVQNNSEYNYSENDFKYPFKKPDNVYSCLLMICDSLDATIKALRQNENLPDEKIPDVISSTISRLANETQIDELTYKQGRIIKDSLISEYTITNNRIIEGYDKDNK